MANDDLGLSGAEGGELGGGANRKQFGMLKAGFKVDTQAVKDLDKEFKTFQSTLAEVRKTLQDIAKLTPKIGGLQGTGTSKSATVTPTAKIAQLQTTTQQQEASNPTADLMAAGGRGGAIARFGAAAVGVASAAGNAFNTRVQRGYDYSLSADKMNLRLQQTTGMTALNVQEKLRQPLMDFRLGGTGINDMLALQRSTGLSNQGSSVDALRTSSGFAYSTADINQQIATMSSAQSNNRMFFMTGMSMYGIGGRENKASDVIRNTVRSLGLTTPSVLKGARQDGSITRQRLEFAGVPVDMQEQILDYAEQNVAYQSKGGKGMYDPSNREQQKFMGINDSFALQKEETDRTKVEREENFYRRQVDNFSDLEKQTQTLTEMFGKLEEKLSGIIGEGISNKPVLGGVGGILKGAGGMLTMAGAGVMFANPLLGAGLMGLGIAGQVAGGLASGDPYDNPSASAPANLKIPTYGKPTTLSGLESNSTFSKMNPKMKERLKKLFIASGGRVGFGGGTRDSAAQRTMFLSRYTPTDEKTGVFWEGKYWKKREGVAAAAPPGRCLDGDVLVLTRRGLISMRDIVVGDSVWTHQNRWRTVTAHVRFEKETVEVHAKGQIPVICTPDHKWFVLPDPMFRKKIAKGGLWDGTHLNMVIKYASDIEGDLLLSPAVDALAGMDIEPPEGYSLTPDFLRFVGKWVADGTPVDGVSGYVYTNLQEVDWFLDVCLAAGVSVKEHKSPADESTRKWFFGVKENGHLGKWLIDNFGYGSTTRYVPLWLIANADKLGEAFLDGYLQGDGHWSDRDGKTPCFNLHAANKRLVLGVRLLMQALGWRTTGKRPLSQQPSVIAEGHGRQSGMTVQSQNLAWMASGYPDPLPGNRDRMWADDQWWASRVDAVIPTGMREVFDITVDEDESFYADGLLTHNSMHEIGLAADLVGDMDWLAANASKFGLKTFGDVNNEPWHVQPSELPNSRRDYEAAGATWGSNGTFDPDATFDGPGGGGGGDDHGDGRVGSGSVAGAEMSYMGMSINEALSTARAQDLAQFMAGSGGMSSTSSGQSSVAPGNSTQSQALSGVMSGKSIVNLYRSVGWSGEDLTKAVGISYRESRWNPGVLANDSDDLSYGLFQINMKGALGPDRRKRYNLSRNEDLYDPNINARVAHTMQTEQGWGPWKIKGDPLGKVDMAAAAQTVREATTGDPYEGRSGGGGGYTTINGGHNVTVSPTINYYSTGNTSADAEMLANEIAQLLEQRVEMSLVRSS